MKTLFKSLLCVVLTTAFTLGASAQNMTQLIGKWVISSMDYEMPEEDGIVFGNAPIAITEKTKKKFAELNTKESKESSLKWLKTTYQYAIEFKTEKQAVESYEHYRFGTANINLQIRDRAVGGYELTPDSMLCPATPVLIFQDEKGNLVLRVQEQYNEGVITVLTYTRKK